MEFSFTHLIKPEIYNKSGGSDFATAQKPMNAMMKRRNSIPEVTAKARRSRSDRSVARRLLSLLKSGADTRVKKVKRIRQSVRTRSYENELKLSIATDRLARELSA